MSIVVIHDYEHFYGVSRPIVALSVYKTIPLYILRIVVLCFKPSVTVLFFIFVHYFSCLPESLSPSTFLPSLHPSSLLPLPVTPSFLESFCLGVLAFRTCLPLEHYAHFLVVSLSQIALSIRFDSFLSTFGWERHTVVSIVLIYLFACTVSLQKFDF